MIPKRPVEIIEVGPRDGLQNLDHYLETDKKIELIRLLVESGLKEIEVGGFVHPKAVPQFRDIQGVVKAVSGIKDVTFTALVPNLRGARNALESGVSKIHFVFSVSKSHNLSNVRRTPEESLDELRSIAGLVEHHQEAQLSVDLATVFGCPFEIEIHNSQIWACLDCIQDIGIRSVALCDTVGFGNPRQVEEIFAASMERYPGITFRAHFHNTRGLGLANALTAYQTGVTSFDSSVGGLGGCPFAPGASGNVATEDQVFMFEEMGLATGVNIRGLFKACRFLEEHIPDVCLSSALYRAGIPGEHRAVRKQNE